MSGLSCFHCGLPVPAASHWSVSIDEVAHAMCCPGCQAVAQAIVDNGLTDYYRNRSSFAEPTAQPAMVPAELQLYDEPEVAAAFVAGAGQQQEAMFSVEGIRCAACVWLIERRVAALQGVTQAQLNVASGMLKVSWPAGQCVPSDILKALAAIGYTAYPFDAQRQGAYLRMSAKILFRRLFVAGLSMMQVMMYAAPAYFAGADVEADMASLMRWASLLLTVPAVTYSALPFFAGAWSNLKNRVLGMDVPVALGIGAAFIGSLHAMWVGSDAVYFDSVTMFIFLLLCSRYLELQARLRAQAALEKLQHAVPASAHRLEAFPSSRDTQTVPAARLQMGDTILVKPGEAVPADCIVLEGATSIDAALLTGESRPLPKAVGDLLPGGAVNIGQPVLARVQKSARESTLSALVGLVERAGQAKPQLALWADRAAAWFVAALLLLALVVFGVWQVIDPARAWPVAIALLVVSCPCALSLATPTALAAATDRLLKSGILVVKPHVLETLRRATHVVFDKTGTLTLGHPVLHATVSFGLVRPGESLQIAAALEQGSAHPLAAALRDAAGPGSLAVSGAVHAAGQGVEGMIGGMRYRLGNASFAGELAGSPAPGAADAASTPVYLASEGQWLARFEVRDRLRDDAHVVVDYFKHAGCEVILLSGDGAAVAQHVGAELGIDQVYAEQLPEDKLAFVQDLQRRGAVVAMAGDGINDAAVLSAADVSFAMGQGAALAQTHADCVLLPDRLSLLCEAADAASRTMRVIRQNLAWALFYNGIAIPAAAFGWLNPWLSAVGMSVSSAVVVLNAMRLCRIPSRRKPLGHAPDSRRGQPVQSAPLAQRPARPVEVV